MSDTANRCVIFAGGGTAGHIEPAIAVARAWQEKYPNDRCIFLGTPTGLENVLVPTAGFEIHNINKVVVPRRLSIDAIKLPVRLWRSVASARKIISGADMLVGFGGYLSGSAYIAARLENVPIVIHEANAKVGWANRMGSLFTKNLAVAQSFTSGSFGHATVTGLPLRSDVKTAYLIASKDWQLSRTMAKKKMGWKIDQPVLLILGGSQGSNFINSQILQALPALRKKGIQILHSIGTNNELPQSYGDYKAVSYISDMATAYLSADVVLARSGAVTCAEVGALGRMAIFVPLPIGNGEQSRNADHLVSIGRAVVVPQVDFSSQWLIEHIDEAIARGKKQAEPAQNQDLDAEQGIVNLMESALRKGKR